MRLLSAKMAQGWEQTLDFRLLLRTRTGGRKFQPKMVVFNASGGRTHPGNPSQG
jgi:hypothetical protein